MPNLIATMSALARTMCLRTHYVRTNWNKKYVLSGHWCNNFHVLLYSSTVQPNGEPEMQKVLKAVQWQYTMWSLIHNYKTWQYII